MLELRTTVQKQDMWTFTYCQMFRRTKIMGVMVLILLVSVGVMAFNWARGGASSGTPLWWIIAAVGSVALIIGTFVSSVQRISKSQSELMGVPRTFLLDDNKFSQIDTEGNLILSIDLAGLKDAYESKELFLIFFESGKCLILSKRDMDKKSTTVIRDMLSAMLGSAFKTKHKI